MRCIISVKSDSSIEKPPFLHDKESGRQQPLSKRRMRWPIKRMAENWTNYKSLLDDKNFLKEIIRTPCQRLLEEEIFHRLQARAYQPRQTRCGHRNGYKQRRIKTWPEELELLVPQDREGGVRQNYLEDTREARTLCCYL